jgi:hypothetical protein
VRQGVSTKVEMNGDVQEMFRQMKLSLTNRLVKQSLGKATRRTMTRTLRRLTNRGTQPAVRKDGSPRPRLADSIMQLMKRFRDGNGYYTVTGASSRQPHAWLYEHGSALRFRKRIGGKYKFVEPLTPIYTKAFGGKTDITHARRTTGYMPAAKVALQTVKQEQAQVFKLFAQFMDEAIRRNAGRLGISAGGGEE